MAIHFTMEPIVKCMEQNSIQNVRDGKWARLAKNLETWRERKRLRKREHNSEKDVRAGDQAAISSDALQAG